MSLLGFTRTAVYNITCNLVLTRNGSFFLPLQHLFLLCTETGAYFLFGSVLGAGFSYFLQC